MKKTGRKLAVLFAALLFGVILWPFSAQAEDSYDVGDYSYKISSGRAYICGYNGSSSSITLPSTVTIEGYNYIVTQIGESAFKECTDLKSVTIPKGYTKIGLAAFNGCVNLESLTILAELEDSESVNTSNAGYSAPFYRTGTHTDGMTVTFGSSVKRVPAYLFATDSARGQNIYPHIKKVELPPSVTTIGEYAFRFCYDLSEINLSEVTQLRTIEKNAFDSSAVTSLDFPARLSEIGEGAFRNCTRIREIQINGDISDQIGYGDSSFYNTGTNTGGITVTFAEGVTRVPSSLFRVFGSYVKQENTYAHVRKVILPKSVSSIGDSAFSQCVDLEEINFSSASNLKKIEQYAFEYTNLKELEFANKLETIGEGAFWYCESIRKVSLPESMKYLSNKVFQHCTQMESIVIQGDLADSTYTNTYNADYAAPFYDTGTNGNGIQVTFDSKVTRVPAYLFATDQEKGKNTYAHIKKVVLPASVTSIGEYAFYRCYDMEEINLGDDASLVSIDMDAFVSTSLKEVVFPEKLKTLGDNAFKNCTKLETIQVNGTIGDRTSADAFYRAGKDTDGITVTFGRGAVRVGSYLFASLQDKSYDIYPNIKKVVFSDNLAQIGEYAFCNCYDLEEVNFEDATRLHTIDTRAFADTSLTHVTFGKNMKRLWRESFWHNSKLTEVVLPESLTDLGEAVFKDCVNLSSLTINGNIENCSYTNTYNSSYAAPFHNSGTSTDSLNVKFGSSVTAIPTYLFATSEDKGQNTYPPIKKITIPSNVKEVGAGAFYNCYDLESAVIQNGNVSFGEKVFFQAENLVVTCPAGGSTEQYMIDNNISIGFTKPKKTTITDVTNGSGFISVKWKKAEGAMKYKVYRKVNKESWKELAETSKCTYKDKIVANGKTYNYKIISLAGSQKSGYSAIGKTIYLTPPSKVKAVNQKPLRIAVSWSKNTKASGFQVRFKTGSADKYADVKGTKAVKKTLTGMKKGKTYKIWVRSYVTSGSKTYYSALSGQVKVKVAK